MTAASSDAARQLIVDLMYMVWYLRANASETTPFGKHDRDQAERLYRRAKAFLDANNKQTQVPTGERKRMRQQLIPKSRIGNYRPGTVVVSSRTDVHFLAAAISDEDADVFLSKRKYADQGKALEFAEGWFLRNVK